MSTFFTCLLIATSLSMDAFSLSLLYGTFSMEKRDMLVISGIVGIFHFFMPLFGLMVGNMIIKYFAFNLNIMVGIIFFIIGLEMIISVRGNKEIKVLSSLFAYLLFGFSVSIDSFTTGIGLSAISNNSMGVAALFMTVSALFTYMGLRFGKVLSNKFGEVATFIGGILMCILALIQIF